MERPARSTGKEFLPELRIVTWVVSTTMSCTWLYP